MVVLESHRAVVAVVVVARYRFVLAVASERNIRPLPVVTSAFDVQTHLLRRHHLELPPAVEGVCWKEDDGGGYYLRNQA